ncbi:hypothetical protein AVEN_76973-1 [Araneus ventricosus]|uniref:Uncharacterized protein n=1 Tax=Araneus ventricosus TaxID=182803 RepID=A0A4Y2MD62_ARAVE|nr:hypothetical protein AVEN_76973-1 [Araneus ventricosus]
MLSDPLDQQLNPPLLFLSPPCELRGTNQAVLGTPFSLTNHWYGDNRRSFTSWLLLPLFDAKAFAIAWGVWSMRSLLAVSFKGPDCGRYCSCVAIQ